MIKTILTIGAAGALIVALIGVYLSPDDLQKCNAAPSSKIGCEKVDAIVAVSGGNTPLRTEEAINLYKNGWSDYLIFSGAAKDTSGPSNAAVMRKQAIDDGVPSGAIFVEGSSKTTHQNAEFVDTIFKNNNIDSVIVVTSPYHQRRAGVEFRHRLGTDATVFNHPAANDPDWPWYWWATPRGWWLAGGEVVKITAAYVGESE